jgi:hypothetical protein
MSFFKNLFKNKDGRLTYGTITPSNQQYMGGGAGDNVNIVDNNYRQDPMPPRDFRDPFTQPQGIQTLVNTYRPPTNLIQQSQQQQQRNMEVANTAQDLANQQANAFASLLGTSGGDTGGGDTGGGNTGGGTTGGGTTGGGTTGGGTTGGGTTGGGGTGGGGTGGGGTGGGGTGGGGTDDTITDEQARQDIIDEIRRKREQDRLPPERPPYVPPPFVPPMDTPIVPPITPPYVPPISPPFVPPMDPPFVPPRETPLIPLISGLEDRDAMRDELFIQRMGMSNPMSNPTMEPVRMNNRVSTPTFEPVRFGIENLDPFKRRV